MINLFEHNQTAYESAAAMLSVTGKAAVIHPAGTGKSFIGFKLYEDNPEKNVCWLSPSDYIFRTQLENLKKTGAEIPQNIKFFTYAKLTYMSDGRREGKVLTDEQIKKLEIIGFQWRDKKELIWLKRYEMLKKYKAENGLADVPKDYTAEDGFKLGIWLQAQKLRQKKGECTEEQDKLL